MRDDADNDTRTHPLDAGRPLGERYVVESLLGEEGGWVLYLARNERLGNRCLARVYTARWCAKPEVRTALKSCVVSQIRVSHPNVESIRDVFSSHDELTVISEFVEGATLRSHLAALGGSLDEDTAVDLTTQILSALKAAQRRGLNHLGLCPDSVWLQADPDATRVIVNGFGVARYLPNPSAEPYWAPEQHEGADTDARTDLFTVGLILHEMLTGRLPAPNSEIALRDLVPTLSLRVERALQRALRPEPDERFSSADEMRNALSGDSLLSPTGLSLSESPPVPRSRRFGRLWLGGVLAASLIAGLASWQLSGSEEARQRLLDLDLLSDLEMGQAELPAITPDTPLPVDALPSLGSPGALVEAVVVTDIDDPFAAPTAFSFLEELQLRYGDNLRISFILAPLASEDTAGRMRARAALVAQSQGAFLPFSEALWRTPTADSTEDLTRLANTEGLDVDAFRLELASAALDARLEHHAQLAAQLTAPRPGDVFINGRRLLLQPFAVLTKERLTRAIDDELDAAQALLTDGILLEDIARRRTLAALQSTTPADLPAPEEHRIHRVDLEGLPSLGAANAPLTLVVYTDHALPSGRALLERARAFYHTHPDRVRVLVKLAPSIGHQAGFDRAISLLQAHAEGNFWEALQAPPELAHDSTAALLRSRVLEQSLEAQALDPSHAPFLLANGHFVPAGSPHLEDLLEQRLALVERVLAAGLSAEEVYLLAMAHARDITLSEQRPRELLVANWRSLPHLGSERAPIKLFWLFSLHDPSWADTLDALTRLRQQIGDERLAVYLVPAPFHTQDTATLELFDRWWELERGALDDALKRLRALARDFPPTLSVATTRSTLLRRYLDAPEDRPPLDGSLPAPDEAPPDIERAELVRNHAQPWLQAQIEPGSVVIARGADATRFNAVVMPGGLAFDLYWAEVR